MWQAEVIKKSIYEGKLVITIKYENTTNGTIFFETHTSKDAQGDDWLKKTVSERITKLDGLYIYEEKLSLGIVDTSVAEEDIEPE